MGKGGQKKWWGEGSRVQTFVTNGWLQVNIHRARNVLACARLGEEGVECVITTADLPTKKGKKWHNGNANVRKREGMTKSEAPVTI